MQVNLEVVAKSPLYSALNEALLEADEQLVVTSRGATVPWRYVMGLPMNPWKHVKSQYDKAGDKAGDIWEQV